MSLKPQNIDANKKANKDQLLDELLILEEAKKLKSVFLDNMSHELRTPITVILGYAGILYEEIEDPDLKEMAEIILKSSNRLTESLNLLLDQSDVNSKRLKVSLEKKNLVELLDETFNVYKPVVEDKGLELKYSTDVDKVFCSLDVKMFKKVISNLFNNAIKFTNSGSIGLHLFIDSQDEEESVCVQISDSGIGIPKEKQTVIFEAFRQVSEGMNRLYQGTGLGLSVTKKFIELMNGKIYVESEVEKGTTFTIKFPKA